MSEALPEIELRPAHVWTCESCGRDNFEHAIVAELSPEEIRELREEHDFPNAVTGQFTVGPAEVTCRGCQTTYRTAEM